MGRGNVPQNENEILFYVDYDNFIDENDEFDNIFLDDFKCELIANLMNKFNSFFTIKENMCCNGLYKLEFIDNEWSVAVKLIPFDNAPLGLIKRHIQTYEEGLKQILFNFFSELGIYTGSAWTSGRIYRESSSNGHL